MKYKITCESSADLSKELLKKLKVSVIPFRVTLGDQDYRDGVDIDSAKLFEVASSTKQLPKTSALNSLDYEEFFKENLTDEDEGLIHFCISSQISSTYNNAVEASKKFKKVHIIDSMSLSTGIGIQVMYACSLRDKGVDINEAVALINNRRESVNISFVVDKLNYLHKGGRCSALSLLGANLLSIKPSILVKNGKMMVGKKYIGKMQKVLDKYILDTYEEFHTPDPEFCVITYSTASEEMLETARNTIKSLNIFKKIYELPAGCTVCTHCGPNTLGIIYFNDGKQD